MHLSLKEPSDVDALCEPFLLHKCKLLETAPWAESTQLHEQDGAYLEFSARKVEAKTRVLMEFGAIDSTRKILFGFYEAWFDAGTLSFIPTASAFYGVTHQDTLLSTIESFLSLPLKHQEII